MNETRADSSLTPTGQELRAIAAIGLTNIALNRIVPRGTEIPAGLAAAAGMVLLASRAGVSMERQGLAPDAAGTGARYGIAIGVPLGALLALGALLPATKHFYRDRSIIAARPGEAAYQMFARIPLATATSEELIFRSAFEGLLSLRRPTWQVRVLSSPLFGLWHVLPALDQAQSNPGVLDVHRGSTVRRTGVIAATVVITALGGLALSWIRDRTQSVLAPIIVHAAVNAGGFAGGWIAARRDQDEQPPLQT